MYEWVHAHVYVWQCEKSFKTKEFIFIFVPRKYMHTYVPCSQQFVLNLHFGRISSHPSGRTLHRWPALLKKNKKMKKSFNVKNICFSVSTNVRDKIEFLGILNYISMFTISVELITLKKFQTENQNSRNWVRVLRKVSFISVNYDMTI